MGYITINERRLTATDEQLDRFAARMEQAAKDGVGFWISTDSDLTTRPSVLAASPPVRALEERAPRSALSALDDDTRGPAPREPRAYGHQRAWVNPTDRVVLIYDRSMSAEPSGGEIRF